ncbi:hypothetical protein [Streptomyces griseofuscus]|nr:hypothetical protein [Streptomyces murinus]
MRLRRRDVRGGLRAPLRHGLLLLRLGYFFAAFLGAKPYMLPALLSAVGVATDWVLLLSLTVLRTNPRRTLRRVREAFGARARAVARASAELLAADPRHHARLRRRLHARHYACPKPR